MAVEWNITPSTEYTTYGNGIKLTIPSENPPAKYIITYSDDNGCMGSTTVIVRTDCGGGGGGDCLCDITGEFNREGHTYPATGSTSDVKIGQITYKGDCTSTTFRRIEIRDGGPSSIWSSASDFDIKPNGEVWATVPPNEYNTMLHVRVYFNCKTSTTASEYDYLNFYQAAGSEPQPADCDVEGDSTLDSYLNGIGASSIKNTGSTSCAYEYIKDIYSKISGENASTYASYFNTIFSEICGYNEPNNNDAMISWALAEVLCELYPCDYSKCKLFFDKAAANYGGVWTPADEHSVNTYTSRLIGAMLYAKVKGDNFSSYLEMAEKARNGLGTTKYTGDIDFSWSSLWSATGYTPSVPVNNECDTQFFEYAYSNYTADTSCTSSATVDSTKERQAIEDKVFYTDYLLSDKVFNLPSSWFNFIDDVRWASRAMSNTIKAERTRLRPTTVHRDYGSKVLLCNCKIEEDIWRTYNGYLIDPTYEDCDAQWEGMSDSDASYPSGHASIVYGDALAVIVADSSKMSSVIPRAVAYGDNRAIVRAHWASDVIIGKVAGSSAIGMLNGCTKFINYVKSIKHIS